MTTNTGCNKGFIFLWTLFVVMSTMVLMALVLQPANAADFYTGVGYSSLEQDIGIQAQNDTPLDDVSAPDPDNDPGCGPGCTRSGDFSLAQAGTGGSVFAGWRSGNTAFEIGYSDLGTWQLMEAVRFDSGPVRAMKSNITMEALHASVLRYTPSWHGLSVYGRLGLGLNRVTARSNYRDYDASNPSADASTTTFTLQATRAAPFYGIGFAYEDSVRLEIRRFADVGVIDYTGTTEVRVIEFQLLMPID
jgi:opacity protein-like surface antigen